MAKKKKEVVEQVSTNEVQEDIIDMMKEVSMQPEVEIPTEVVEEVVSENEITEEVEAVVEEDSVEEVIKNEIPTEVETVGEENSVEEKAIGEHETDFVIDKIIEDVKKNNDCDYNPKPRMSYKQMMGYDWNGQNFDM